ncbi:hypothetical protein KPHVMX_220008 [Klebsiella pneumoniae]|nr:hypothetical protein KPHVMX_220008 [Klebsiella pneumoniae]
MLPNHSGGCNEITHVKKIFFKKINSKSNSIPCPYQLCKLE